MDELKTKQQVVEKIKESAKILVTVSNSPSVDALSAALALTLLLDKQEKYATSIFSGETPPAIAFLQPEKTFDDTTDSLRDFIIALNKEKADHLRYKVEGDAVKIFITPYKTTIDQSDLEFSQGDYNVELVIALGVDNQDHLDAALENHGQILHDAAIVTLTNGKQTSNLGGIDWHDSNASSLSEMVAGLAEAMKTDKKKSLLDEQIATALLTGIVAETDRFSNENTTSKSLTVAAALMSAGADQQLISNELQAARQVVELPQNDDENSENSSENSPENTELNISNNKAETSENSNDGTLTIEKDRDPTSLEIVHDKESLADLDLRVLGEEEAKAKVIKEVEILEEEAANNEDVVSNEQPVGNEQPANNEQPDDGMVFEATPLKPISNAYATEEDEIEPTLGGALNATTEQAADDARREAENSQNKTILSHAYLGNSDETQPSGDVLTSSAPEGFPGTPNVAPGSLQANDMPNDEDVHSAYAPENSQNFDNQAPIAPMSGLGGERVIQPLSNQAAPVPSPAPSPVPSVAPSPSGFDLPLPPPIPDFSQVNSPAPALPLPAAQQPAILGDILAPEPSPYGLTSNQYEPAPNPYASNSNEAYAPVSNAVPAPNTAYAPENQVSQNGPADPTQFQIPPAQQ